MKIALTTSGSELTAPLDQRFGRAPQFLVYNTENREFSIISNDQNLNAPQGAGIQSAQNVAAAEADVVISGHCGPKAYKVLTAAGIKVYPCTAPTVEEAIKLFQEGKLTASSSADVEGHWV